MNSTNSTLAELKALANEAAEQSEINMAEASTGGGDFKLYPEGYALARLVEYTEFGKHADEYQGKIKPPALTFRLGYAIWGKPPGQQETFHNADGSPGIIRTFDLRMSNNERASAKIAFDRMNYKGGAKQFYQFIGEPFLIHVIRKQGADPSKPARNRIVLKDTLPPFDPATGTPYEIPEAPEDMYRLFIWNRPTKEGWDSLYVEGTTDDGRSKNFLQEKCLVATDFPGSPLEAMLSGAGDLPSPEQQAAPAVPDVPAAPSAPAAPAAPAVPAPPPVPGV